MKQPAPVPSRAAWPLLWFAAILITFLIADRSQFGALTNWLLVGALWGGLALLLKWSDPYSAFMPQLKGDDPYIQGALVGGFVALLAARALAWLFPDFERSNPVDDEDGGGSSMAIVLAMIAVYLIARKNRIGQLLNQPPPEISDAPEPGRATPLRLRPYDSSKSR